MTLAELIIRMNVAWEGAKQDTEKTMLSKVNSPTQKAARAKFKKGDEVMRKMLSLAGEDIKSRLGDVDDGL